MIIDSAIDGHIRGQQPSSPPARRQRQPAAADVHRGTIAGIHAAGFAWVRPDGRHDGLDPDDDLFVHRSRMQAGLAKGDRVTYELHQSRRRPDQLEARQVKALRQ
jgi:cold shock CspA family protein